MIGINSTYGEGRFCNSVSLKSGSEMDLSYMNGVSEQSFLNVKDSLSLTTNGRSETCFSSSSFSNAASVNPWKEITLGQKWSASSSFIPRNLNEQEAESLSNQQLKAEYDRHKQISSDSATKQEQCIGHSLVLNQNKEQAVHMNKLGATLKQNGQKMGQQALAQITAGLALYASGTAMEAAGKAMLACPFTKAAGAALISKGRALKQRGLHMQKSGQKLEISSKTLLASGFSLGKLATRKLNTLKQAWQLLNNVYQQVKNIGELAQNSMLCAESVGRKRGLNIADTSGASKPTTTTSASATLTKNKLNMAQNSQLVGGFNSIADSSGLSATI